MKLLAALLALALAFTPPPATAQPPDEAGMRAAIERQLAALQRGDPAAAFAIASPAIQQIFGDDATFMRMVERGFPQLYRSTRHRFLNLDTADGNLIQRVLVESDAGSVIARYEMVSIDGQWRINGCTIEKAEDA